MKTLVINDLHFGVKRQGGATPQSRLALEEWMFSEFERLLEIPHDELIILGDLCDKRNVPEHIMLRLIELLRGRGCTIVLGNHDLQGVSGGVTMSSTELIAGSSESYLIKEPTLWNEGLYIIPHLFNQEEFDAALEECPGDVTLLVHCNIDNPFAVGDHSLNITNEQLDALAERNIHVIAAHEHQPRKYKNVDVIGNQIPTSIADCLGDDKRALVLEDGEPTWVPFLKIDDVFIDVPYTELGNGIPDKKFIRIRGECSQEEYPDVFLAVTELRKTSSAFVISNMVKIEGVTVDSSVTEDVEAFNIMELLLEQVDEEYREDVKLCI